MQSNIYKAYTLGSLFQIKELNRLDASVLEAIQVTGRVFPFKVNNYVIEQLIDWSKAPDDPLFRATFPQKEMLHVNDYLLLKSLIDSKDKKRESEIITEIRSRMNPHPSGQVEYNLQELNDGQLTGIQHKYSDIILFFPSKGQTCHAYCTFCFRWPQFVNESFHKFREYESASAVAYLQKHKDVREVLITGGDPMIMSVSNLKFYIEPLLAEDLSHISSIRVGSKALSFWPYRFTEADDAQELLEFFAKIVESGKHLSFMAHFNHVRELESPAVKKAIAEIRRTGVVIRTQSPLLKHVNDSEDVWIKMWQSQVQLGLIPYYMFIARDTGAHDYFAVTLIRALEIYQKAITQVSGLCRTVRGPVMSTTMGKLELLACTETGRNVQYSLRYIRHRDPSLCNRLFYANGSPDANWISDLLPASIKDAQFF